jgi:cobalamin biosynthesis Mg chelatase CobN
VRTIDEIAFQTNLLALNAAVEAARAGDTRTRLRGRREEVRALALRSAEAARNTAALIDESVGHAERGVAINAEVLAAFATIDANAGRVDAVVAEIAGACAEQTQGVAHINEAVERMNEVTQQVAAAREQSASAATEMSSQAESLTDMVRGFQLTASAQPADADTRADTNARRAVAPGRHAERAAPAAGPRAPQPRDGSDRRAHLSARPPDARRRRHGGPAGRGAPARRARRPGRERDGERPARQILGQRPLVARSGVERGRPLRWSAPLAFPRLGGAVGVSSRTCIFCTNPPTLTHLYRLYSNDCPVRIADFALFA